MPSLTRIPLAAVVCPSAPFLAPRLLRATVPVHALYVAEGTDRDEKIREIFKLAAEQHVSLLEIGRIELDKLTGEQVVGLELATGVPLIYELSKEVEVLSKRETSH